MKQHIKNFFTSDYIVILSLFLGAAFGLFFKEEARHFYFLGDAYMKLLQVAVVPLVIFTISKSIYEINTSSTKLVSKAFLLSIFVTIFSVGGSILFSLFIKPWNYISDISNFNSLFANLANASPIELGVHDKFVSTANANLIDFLVSIIPKNIFHSLDTGNMLQIVFASIMVIFFMHNVSKKNNSEKTLYAYLEYGYDTFNELNDFIVSLMSIGVFFLMANQFVDLDIRAITALTMLTLTIISFLLILIFFYILIFCLKYKISLHKFFSTFYKSSIIILTTRSQIVAMPSTLTGMKNLGCDKSIVDVYLPLGLSLLRIGTMCFFAIVTLFIMGIFDVPITFNKVIFILIGCSIAGIATVGTTGIISLQLISVVLDPLGLPMGGVMAILIAIDTIVDLFDTYLNFIANIMIASVIDNKFNNK